MRVTETELRAARAQLQGAFDQLTTTKSKLDTTQATQLFFFCSVIVCKLDVNTLQGELGLTKSENEILKRELDSMRK